MRCSAGPTQTGGTQGAGQRELVGRRACPRTDRGVGRTGRPFVPEDCVK